MSIPKNLYLTIGQFAQLYDINKKTLMWYDETDLFKPAIKFKNGYRGYAYSQCATFETILMLRELNVSLPDIDRFLKNRSAVTFKNLLDDKITEVNTKIRQLEKIRNIMELRKKSTENLIDIDISEISVNYCKSRYYLFINTSKNNTFETEITEIYNAKRNDGSLRSYCFHYGSVVSVENLRNGCFDEYFGIFMESPNEQANAYKRPEGNYLCAYCKGDWNKLPDRYTEILKFADARGLHLCGNAYETGLNDFLITSADDYITKIEIQITS